MYMYMYLVTFANPVKVCLGFAAQVPFGQTNVKKNVNRKREKNVANPENVCKHKKNPSVQT